jgi:hypothetical protein
MSQLGKNDGKLRTCPDIRGYSTRRREAKYIDASGWGVAAHLQEAIIWKSMFGRKVTEFGVLKARGKLEMENQSAREGRKRWGMSWILDCDREAVMGSCLLQRFLLNFTSYNTESALG